MKKRNFKSILAVVLTLALSAACLAGCGQSATDPSSETADGGVLRLSVNPEIEIFYDREGMVTKVQGVNDDGREILEPSGNYIGKDTRKVVTDLVSAIGAAGYFVEDLEGEGRKITIEIESGSEVPYAQFLDEVVADVQDCVAIHHWNSPVILLDDLDDLYDDLDDIDDKDDLYDDLDDIDDGKDDLYDDLDDIDDDKDDLYDDLDDIDDDKDDLYDDLDDIDDDKDDPYDDLDDIDDDKDDLYDDLDDINDDKDDLYDDLYD